MKSVLALIDCRYFYVSVERVWNSSLRGKPVLVLGNNDSAVVALSDEARALGIRRGMPVFECKDIIEQHHILCYSSNYPLYGDFSARVRQTLLAFASSPELLESYSIDEWWLDAGHIAIEDLVRFGREIRATILQHVGLVKENKVALLSRHSGQCCLPSLMARSVGKSVSCLTRTRLPVVFRIIKSLSCLETHPKGVSMLD